MIIQQNNIKTSSNHQFTDLFDINQLGIFLRALEHRSHYNSDYRCINNAKQIQPQNTKTDTESNESNSICSGCVNT